MFNRTALVIVALVIASAPAYSQDARIGLEENFDTMDGWAKLDFKGEAAPLKEMTSLDGIGLFVTHPAPLKFRRGDPKWMDGMADYDAFSNIAKTYPAIDLDKYRYLVMKIDEKGVPTAIIVNHVDLPVAYTTGVHAIDLSQYDKLKGTTEIQFRIQFLNTGMQTKLDYFRFVSELTPQEKRTLIAPGIAVRSEHLRNDTTQGLGATVSRIGRPRRNKLPAERLCFRDSATGAVIWRMTGLQSGASSVSDSARTMYNGSGSHMLLPGTPGGPQLWDLKKQTYKTIPMARISRFSIKEPHILWCIEKTRKPTGIRFHKLNVVTGVDEVAGEIEYDAKESGNNITELGFSRDTDMIVVGLRETPHVFIFDPREADRSKRVRHVELPMRLKGMDISPDGKRIFFSRCYWYESWQMNLETGQVERAMRFGGSHAGSGGGMRLGHDSGVIVGAPEGFAGSIAGDRVRIVLNYRDGWHTDYGHLTEDRLWYIVNGTGEPMRDRIVMAMTGDPASVMQIAQINTSRNSWSNNPVVKSSPDHTKVVWTSDLWGYNAICVAYTRRPAPPRNLTGWRQAKVIHLRWARQIKANTQQGRLAETYGFNIYRSVDGGAYLPLNTRPIAGRMEYVDRNVSPDSTYRYIVCAIEHSGLEGTPSNEFVSAPEQTPTPTHTLHVEAEQCHVQPAGRIVFNGYAGSWRYVRIGHQADQIRGVIQRGLAPQIEGDYALWLRVKTQSKPGAWTVRLGTNELGSITVTEKDWQWVKLDKPLALAPGKTKVLKLISADNGLCIDKFIVTTDGDYVPKAIDDRFTVAPKKLEYLIAKDVTESSVNLTWWNPNGQSDIEYYNVYVGTKADFPPDQAHLICSTKKFEVLDWGLAPGTNYFYKVVAVNRRGLMSAPAVITVQTKPVAQRVLLELKPAYATLDERLTIATNGGVRYVTRPYPGEGHKSDPPADITWKFDLPVSDEYVIWCKYAPAEHSRRHMKVPVVLDDFLQGKRWDPVWVMRTPYRSMKGPRYKNYKEDLWFMDKIVMYVWPRPHDLYSLSAGEHTLTLKMNPEMDELSHKIAAVWVTNDQSFRPVGYDPQANFTKKYLQRK